MPYVDRNSGGIIVGVFTMPQRGGQEFVLHDNADLLAFQDRPHSAPDIIGRIDNDKAFNALIGVLADRFGVPRGVLRSEIVAKART